jgi:hypothetical protein
MLYRYKLQETFGFHLIHRHEKIEENMIRVETSLKSKQGTWTKSVAIDHVNLNNIHGSLFMLQPGSRFVAYEYREGQPKPSLATADPTFFHELADYLFENNLAGLIALEVLDENRQHIEHWVEYELEGGSTVVLSKLDTNPGAYARATGWRQRQNEAPNDPDPQPGTHYEETTKGTHRVFVKKRELQNEEGLIGALRAANVLRAD